MLPDVVQGDGMSPVLERLIQLEAEVHKSQVKNGIMEGSCLLFSSLY